MPRYNTLIHCNLPQPGKQATILPQAQMLLFEGHMYNVDDAEGFGFPRLIRLYQRNYEFHITVYPKQVLSFDGMSLITERCFKVTMHKYGHIYRHTFLGVCFRDCLHDPTDWYSSQHLTYYDNRTWKWKYIQQFMRRHLHRWKAQRRLALAMALHVRLGSESLLSSLPSDIMQKFISY
jgi:hypothetical protein